MEPREKPAQPQISPDLFRKLMDYPEIDRGTKVYQMLDQRKSHWQFKCYTIKGVCNKGLICLDDQGKPTLLNPHSLFIYQGHA